MSEEVALRYLRDYIAIPSVNPMGRSDLAESVTGERRYAECVSEDLRRIGLDAVVIGEGDRASVIAEATCDAPIDTLLVASHLDTVPIDGMTIDPFDPVVRAGRLYGRGSCDTKAGMAALLAALERVLPSGRLRRNVVIVGEADEEFGSRGVFDVLDHLGAATPDWVLATEPTELRVVNCHKGIAVAKLAAHGRACHSSDPSLGSNAIVKIAHAAVALDRYASETLAERRDPRLGPATLSIGLSGGGHAPNIVPDEAWLVAERRLLPGEDGESARRDFESALQAGEVDDVEIVSCHTMKPPLGTPDDHPATRACLDAFPAAERELGSVAFGTDAGVFAERGIPGVVLGPGSIDQAHTADEYVPIAEVERMVGVFERLLTGAT